MKEEILALLEEGGEYVSGQELCERFGVSRTAVWKAVEQLKKDGYDIRAVRNRGYLLVKGEEVLFNQRELELHMQTSWAGHPLCFHESIGSTNVEAARVSQEGAEHGTLVVADQQTAGRGRRGRTWISPQGKNIYFSLLLKPELPPMKAPMLTLVMALAVAKALTKLSSEMASQVAIKWPNDVVIGGKKVTGILTEMRLEQDYIQDVVIGVGINVKAQDFEATFAEHATTVEQAMGIVVNRPQLVGSIMQEFESCYDRFMQSQDLALLKEDYEHLLVNMDKQVRVMDPKGEFEGVARGINSTGELLVERLGGDMETVYAGEVSVRGLYGYV